MLDFAHGLMLSSVVATPEDDHESPALENLLACGLVERASGGLRVTPSGHEAHSRSAPTRKEMWMTRVLALSVAVLAVTTIAGWFA